MTILTVQIPSVGSDVCTGSPMTSCFLKTSELFLNWASQEPRIYMTESSKIWLRSSVKFSCGTEGAVADVYELPSVQEKLHTGWHSGTPPKHLDPLHHRCENVKFLALKSVRFEILIAVNMKVAVGMW